MTANNEEELGKAIHDKKERIEVKGPVAHRIRRLYGLDRVMWCLCLACLAVAVLALMQAPATLGGTIPISMVAGTPAAALVGVPAAKTAILVAASGGGIGILKQMRGYRLEEIDQEHIVLHRNGGEAK